MHSENWDDLRYVLAVADLGSVSAAAKALGVNHATVLRRVAAFETRSGAQIFHRGPRGYVVRAEQRRLIEAAREVEAGFGALDRMMRGAQAPLAGVVRVTSTDSFTSVVLPPIVARLMADEAALRIELLTGNQHSDFARLQADVAVRPAQSLPDDLRGEVAADLGFAAYARADTTEGPWLGLSGVLARTVAAKWLDEAGVGDRVAGRADSFVTLTALVGAGAGRAVLPCILGDRAPGLVRLGDGRPLASVPVWVACHADLVEAPRLKAVRGALATGLAAMAAPLAGTGLSR
ncbi:LysR family transcriptional regulator [Palleronia sp. KMU-117]|uniref:LysR family transcriptional regulator n=1 Tax=Palleronia sp. KMU-117 TaxID=3434108 RepID=UPI003D75E2FE